MVRARLAEVLFEPSVAEGEGVSQAPEGVEQNIERKKPVLRGGCASGVSEET